MRFPLCATALKGGAGGASGAGPAARGGGARVYGNLLRQILSRDERDQIFRRRAAAGGGARATPNNPLKLSSPSLCTPYTNYV
ncbi:hypothetical protein EVAR_33949_1 [Eumeta japonica]|uniref:Uncharacterized protein n=1 Tax=Eumeta variegata TaxID=151549 RepID=A0A4C1VX73_EUMVA|nr:hypothetical protein EVAR_33949_1 [Eumeta japonica]